MKRLILKMAVVVLALNLLYPFVDFMPSRLRFIALVVVGFICAITVDYAVNKLSSSHRDSESGGLQITNQQLKMRDRLASRTPPVVEGCPDCGGKFELDGMNELLRIYECKECERRTFEENSAESPTNQAAE